MPPPFQLLVDFVQKHVGQQRREWAVRKQRSQCQRSRSAASPKLATSAEVKTDQRSTVNPPAIL
jgi:hypothetical protein